MNQRRTTDKYNKERQLRRSASEGRNSNGYSDHAAGYRTRSVSERTSSASQHPSRAERSVFHVSTLSSVVFLVVFIYILISVVSYLRSETVTGYEVRTGSLSSDQIYTGIAIRQETVVGSEYPGHVNYYCREGDRLSVGNLAYTIDESGRILEYLNSEIAGESILSKSDQQTLQSKIIDYTSDFDPHSFSNIYDFKSSFLNEVQKMSSSYVLNDIESLSESGLTDAIHKCYTTQAGIMIFSYDGFESRTADSLVQDDFSPSSVSSYSKNQLTNNALVDIDDPVYKIVTDENWSIVIKCTPDDAAVLNNLGYVKVRFLKDQAEIWAKVSLRGGEDADTVYVTLSFTNSMCDYCSDRYLKIELLISDQTGLKVPNSAIIQADFFLVPKEYITVGTGGNKGVLRKAYSEDGKESTEFVVAVPYSETDTDYYLDQSALSAGDVLVMPDSTETFTVSGDHMDSLTGVYNINKGYADFRQVTIKSEDGILCQNDEYSIVEPNTEYGLVEYDRIVLNANEVTPNTLIFK